MLEFDAFFAIGSAWLAVSIACCFKLFTPRSGATSNPVHEEAPA